jgi:outer membrane protein assembly factor BamB
MSIMNNGGLLGAAALLLGLAQAGPAQEWTRFRGPNGSGISAATTIPVRFTEKDYNWKVKLSGVGHSSPVLWGERIFVTSGAEATGKRLVLCLRASDGSRFWSREFVGDKHGKHTDNSFASATPAVDEKYLFLCWATPKEYIVQALDHDGKDVWRIDLGCYKSGHGFGSSPIVHEDMVIVCNDQDGTSSVVALERDTGKVRWKTPRQSKASYATPCIYQPKGKAAELIFTSWELGITAIDPKTGKANWASNIFSKGHVETPISSPIVAGDLVLGTCGWLGVKKEVVAVRPGANEKQETVYRIDRAAPLCTTPLAKDDLLFLWSDEGLASCANATTGEVYWRERVPGAYYGSPVWINNRVYCMSRDGDLIVLSAAKKFEQVARLPLGEGSHATPAIAGGTMYLRTFSQLISVGGKEPK